MGETFSLTENRAGVTVRRGSGAAVLIAAFYAALGLTLGRIGVSAVLWLSDHTWQWWAS